MLLLQTAWANVNTPIAHSQYVTQLQYQFHQLIPVIKENLHDLPNQYYNFCTKFVTAFIAKFISNLYKCKPLSQGGAEQLLLDSHTLKKTLLDLPEYSSLGSSSLVNKIPQSYISTVINGMTKAEMILKIVLVSSTPPEMFVENYFKLFQEKDISEFQKILDMKGIKKSENALLSELFRKKCLYLSKDPTAFNTNNEVDSQEVELNSALDSSRIKRLEKLIKKRL